MARLSVVLLGSFQVTLDNTPITTFESDKVRALLAYLAVEADRPHRREALTGLLWPDSPEQAARRNLSQALFNLRQVIGDHTAAPPYLLISREAVQFNEVSDHWLDVSAFRSFLTTCDRHSHRRLETCPVCAQQLQQATAIYRGNFLQQFFLDDSDTFEEWAVLEREKLHRLVLDALGHLANYHEQRSEYEPARQAAWRQLELDPWREEAHRQVMRALSLGGQRSAALAQYETCRRVLMDELGVEPSEETTALYEQIRAAEGAPTEAQRAAVHHPAGQLPTSLTPFIGREQELTELAGLLNDPACRLITLVGPGGSGKTRLALQAATDQREAFIHGAGFVPLTPVNSAEFIVPAMADALGFMFPGPSNPKAQLLAYLRGKQMLLILDNLEHLLSATGLLVDILQHAPEVKLLVTSRERLNVPGEWVFEVEGLPLPKSEREDAFETSAIVLFRQCARRMRVGFTLSAAERPVVARICQLVEGMPLGIELAAAWVRLLSCAEIAQEIERSLDFLVTSGREVPERHSSLRAVFEHSWTLLSDGERQVLRQLSIFRGGFQRAAAEQIAGASLPLLAVLVDKSLLRRNAAGRYDMHELVRQYATVQLQYDPQEDMATHDRHCAYYTGLLRDREQPLKSINQQVIVAELSAEIDNVRLAWEWAITHRMTAAIRQTVRTLSWFYELRGWHQEGATTFQRAGASLGGTGEMVAGSGVEHVITVGQVLGHHGWFYFRQGQFGPARDLLQQSLMLLRPYGASVELVDTLNFLGVMSYMMGEYVASRQFLQESLAISSAVGDQWGRAISLLSLGRMTQLLGEYREAQRLLRENLEMWRTIGDPRGTGLCLSFLSAVALAMGECAEAQTFLREGLGLASTNSDRWGIATALNYLGLVAHAQGEYLEACYLFRESLALFHEIGERWSMARALNNLGHANEVLGAYLEAQQYFYEALRIALEAQTMPVALAALVGVATLLAHDQQTEQSLELLAHVLTHPASSREAKDQAESLRVELETQLSSQQVEAVRARAQAKSFEVVAQELLISLRQQ